MTASFGGTVGDGELRGEVGVDDCGGGGGQGEAAEEGQEGDERGGLHSFRACGRCGNVNEERGSDARTEDERRKVAWEFPAFIEQRARAPHTAVAAIKHYHSQAQLNQAGWSLVVQISSCVT